MEFHLTYGVSLAIWDHTPATRHKWAHPALTLAIQAGTRFTYPGGMEGWVDLGVLSHTEMVYPPAGGHPSSTNRAQCRLTTLIEAYALTTTLRRHPQSQMWETENIKKTVRILPIGTNLRRWRRWSLRTRAFALSHSRVSTGFTSSTWPTTSGGRSFALASLMTSATTWLSGGRVLLGATPIFICVNIGEITLAVWKLPVIL